MNRIFDWALARAQERSTWIGLASLLSGAGIAVSPELLTVVAEVGLAASGLLLIGKEERPGPAKD